MIRQGAKRRHVLHVVANEAGFGALIMVIWIVVMLMAIAGEFSYSMKTEINIMTNFKEEEEAYRLALAGMEKAKMELLLMKQPDYVYFDESTRLMLGEPGEEEQLPAAEEYPPKKTSGDPLSPGAQHIFQEGGALDAVARMAQQESNLGSRPCPGSTVQGMLQ